MHQVHQDCTGHVATCRDTSPVGPDRAFSSVDRERAEVGVLAMLRQAYTPRTSAGLVEVHVHPLKLKVAVALQQQRRSGKAFAAVDILESLAASRQHRRTHLIGAAGGHAVLIAHGLCAHTADARSAVTGVLRSQKDCPPLCHQHTGVLSNQAGPHPRTLRQSCTPITAGRQHFALTTTLGNQGLPG